MGPLDLYLLYRLSRLAGRFEELLWLRAAARAGVLEALDGDGAAAAELAPRLGGPPEVVEAFLDAGFACGWLRLADGRFRLSGRAVRLASRPALRAFILYEGEVRERSLRLMPEVLRGGAKLAMDPGAPPIIAEVSSLALPHALKVLGRIPGLARAGARILDAGCGTGEYLSALCGRFPLAQGLGIDLDPGVVSLASDTMQRAGFSGRVQIRAGDIRTDPLDPPYTLILANEILHYFPLPDRSAVVARMASLLEPGAHLAVQQLVRPARGARRPHAFFDLFLSAHTGLSRIPAAGEVAALLRDAGLEPRPPRRIAGLRTLLCFIARKP